MGLILSVPGWRVAPPQQEPARWRRWLPAWLAMAREPKALGAAQTSEEELAAQAFYELFSRYQKPIADFLFRMTRDRDWAADLTQDTFLKAFAHISELPNITNVRAWLYRIAANTASNAMRHQRRFVWIPLAEVRSGDSSSQEQGIIVAAHGDLATSVVERDALENALTTLSPTARAAVLLRATAGFEAHEIATMLGITEANARKTLYRAKEKLRQVLTANSLTAEKERP